MRAGLYARVSTQDQQTLPLQLATMRDYAAKRGWKTTLEVQDIGSGATLWPKREELVKAARRRGLIGSLCGNSTAGGGGPTRMKQRNDMTKADLIEKLSDRLGLRDDRSGKMRRGNSGGDYRMP